MTSDDNTDDSVASSAIDTGSAPPAAILRNEFSLVEVGYVRRGDSVSLLVHDSITGAETLLDATELESLARAPHESFRRLLREIDDGTDGELLRHEPRDRTTFDVPTSHGQANHGDH